MIAQDEMILEGLHGGGGRNDGDHEDHDDEEYNDEDMRSLSPLACLSGRVTGGLGPPGTRSLQI